MSSSADRVFIIGGTGNIGTKLVNDLLGKKVPVTLYARTPSKIDVMFPNSNGLINIVKGNYTNLDSFKEGVKGHRRLFLLVSDFSDFVKFKTDIARIAYESGVKQIVDISSYTVNMGWRTSYIGAAHYGAEKAIFDLPNRGNFVALRPGRFLTNTIVNVRPSAEDKIYDIIERDTLQGVISTNDIGAVAAVVLTEDIAKHGDAVYSLTGDVVSYGQISQIVSDIVGREITYQQIKPVQKYNKIMESGHFPHLLALDLCCGLNSSNDDRITPEIEILLGREPETLKQFFTANKAAFN